MQLGTMLGREAHIGEHVFLGGIVALRLAREPAHGRVVDQSLAKRAVRGSSCGSIIWTRPFLPKQKYGGGSLKWSRVASRLLRLLPTRSAANQAIERGEDYLADRNGPAILSWREADFDFSRD